MDGKSLAAHPFVFNVIDQIFTLQYVCLASIMILYYDHVLTLPSEVKHIWQQKFSLVSLIFVLNRYLAFFGYVPIMFFFFNSPLDDTSDSVHDPRCLSYSRFPGALYCISQILIGGMIPPILIIRVYALYYREIWVLVLTGMLGLSTVATSIVSWSLTMTFDITITILTLFRTFQMYRAHKSGGMQSDIIKLFLRDGSLYFR
ncbi:hypothetical protein BD410DRAFT_814517 [Rickenella mellea]|uniref:DUF6533 domain-containing protein n=1 Tax=Rickenella mellea TaxID=50990 RepID=A0A4Y7Q804_9AGAM|nr:hypothetical protein BD410DRAFT_814517 [Rickenella mellea]